MVFSRNSTWKKHMPALEFELNKNTDVQQYTGSDFIAKYKE